MNGPIDLVILEGWMLGFRPARLENHNDMRILKDNDGMDKVNEKLNVYKKWE